jgi:DNA-binding HxlR family transcriptional regulator
MDFQTYDASVCIMTRIFKLIGGKWKPIILYLIKNNINRFGLMKRAMPRINKKVLTEQLRELESDGLLLREIIEADAPQVIVYHLTEKGLSTRHLIDEMIKWGMENFKEDYPQKMIEEYSFKKSVLEFKA